jgi:hypothetical protein
MSQVDIAPAGGVEQDISGILDATAVDQRAIRIATAVFHCA